jgi:ribonuclease VapC
LILDTSAVVAILRDESDAERFALAIQEAHDVRVSAGTYIEIGIVMDRVGDPVVSRRTDQLLDAAGAIIEPVTREQAWIARAAYRDFGKRSGHRARLDFGDCFAYALAKDRGEPLLFKGDDFSYTDVEVA